MTPAETAKLAQDYVDLKRILVTGEEVLAFAKEVLRLQTWSAPVPEVGTPEFQQQMHFMSCQAEMLDGEGNDVSAGVMRGAIKVLVAERKRVRDLEGEVGRLAESLDKAIDTQADQILKMTDEQIKALCRLEGHDPEDQATIARQVGEIAILKHKLAQLSPQKEIK